MIRTQKNDLLRRLQQDNLTFAGLGIDFQRTCRVPEGRLNSLPAGLGSFPLFKVSDFRSGAPKEWRDDSYFFPMYRQEAMWINFQRGYTKQPMALIIGAGNINALSGKPFDPRKGKERKKAEMSNLDIKLEKEQNYLVVPPQPWLDGWKAEDGKVYQFVAAEMGSGETVEGQITGEEKVGGLQFILYAPKDGKKLIPETRPNEYMTGGSFGGMELCCIEEIGGVDEPHSMEDFCSMEEEESCFLGATNDGDSDAFFALSSKSAAKHYALPPTRDRGAVRTRGAIRRVQSMGLGRGGEIEQKIYPDTYGLEVWNPKPAGVERIYLVSSEDFRQVTGHEAPPTPVTYERYQQLGLPWFELYDKKLGDSKGSDVFAKLKPVGEGKAKSA